MLRHSRKGVRSPLWLDRLESREVLDGGISAVINGGGDLSIKGDQFANALRIDQVGSSFTVTGFTPSGGTPTEINGVPNGTLTFSGVTGLKVKLGKGDDFLVLGAFSNPVFAGNVQLHMGAGNDRITADGLNVSGNLDIHTGSGDDFVISAGTVVGGDTAIDLGTGDDRLNLIAGIFGGSFLADGGDGTDDLDINGIGFFAQPPVYLGFEL